MHTSRLHLQINRPIDRFTIRYSRFIARVLIATNEFPTLAEIDHYDAELYGFGPFAKIEYLYPGIPIHRTPDFEACDQREAVSIRATAYFRHRNTDIEELIQMSRKDCPMALDGLRLYALSATGPANCWQTSNNTRDFLPGDGAGMLQVMRYAQKFSAAERNGIKFDSVARGKRYPQFANQLSQTCAAADPRAHRLLDSLIPQAFDIDSIAA